MAKRLANKQRLLLIVLIVVVALVAGRSARRRDAAPRPFPPPVPRRPIAPDSGTPARPTASPGALAAMEPDSTEASPNEPVPGPFPGSVLPRPDGGPPSPEFVIKGNANSMRCHGPSSPYYRRTRAEVWFRTERDAVAAGFRPWAPKGQ